MMIDCWSFILGFSMASCMFVLVVFLCYRFSEEYKLFADKMIGGTEDEHN
jgi:hypothetical protein